MDLATADILRQYTDMLDGSGFRETINWSVKVQRRN